MPPKKKKQEPNPQFNLWLDEEKIKYIVSKEPKTAKGIEHGIIAFSFNLNDKSFIPLCCFNALNKINTYFDEIKYVLRDFELCIAKNKYPAYFDLITDRIMNSFYKELWDRKMYSQLAKHIARNYHGWNFERRLKGGKYPKPSKYSFGEFKKNLHLEGLTSTLGGSLFTSSKLHIPENVTIKTNIALMNSIRLPFINQLCSINNKSVSVGPMSKPSYITGHYFCAYIPPFTNVKIENLPEGLNKNIKNPKLSFTTDIIPLFSLVVGKDKGRYISETFHSSHPVNSEFLEFWVDKEFLAGNTSHPIYTQFKKVILKEMEEHGIKIVEKENLREELFKAPVKENFKSIRLRKEWQKKISTQALNSLRNSLGIPTPESRFDELTEMISDEKKNKAKISLNDLF